MPLRSQGAQWKRRWLVPAIVAALGVGAGFWGRTALSGKESAESFAPLAGTKSTRRDKKSGPISDLKSGDTVEELVADTSSAQYGRIALWLLDANADEIAKLWRELIASGGERSPELILRRWVELDPQGAMAAARAAGYERIAWWAWGRADPEAALEAALGQNAWAAKLVLRAIGEFDPGLAQDLMAKFPRAAGPGVIEGIAEGMAERDPQEAVEFTLAHGQLPTAQMITWAERDPVAFLAWCAENQMSARLASPVNQALHKLALEHPEQIGEFVDSLPPGQLQRETLRAGVKALAGDNPEAALALVTGERAALWHSEMYAELGKTLATVNLDRSLELLRSASSHASGRIQLSVAPNGTTSITGDAYFASWIYELGKVNPLETLEVVREHHPESERSVTLAWMQTDLTQFAQWLEDEPPTPGRQSSIPILVDALVHEEVPRYREALTWAAQVENVQRRHRTIWDVMGRWGRAESREAAEAYLASPDAPEGLRTEYEELRAEHEEEQNRGDSDR